MLLNKELVVAGQLLAKCFGSFAWFEVIFHVLINRFAKHAKVVHPTVRSHPWAILMAVWKSCSTASSLAMTGIAASAFATLFQQRSRLAAQWRSNHLHLLGGVQGQFVAPQLLKVATRVTSLACVQDRLLSHGWRGFHLAFRLHLTASWQLVPCCWSPDAGRFRMWKCMLRLPNRPSSNVIRRHSRYDLGNSEGSVADGILFAKERLLVTWPLERQLKLVEGRWFVQRQFNICRDAKGDQ